MICGFPLWDLEELSPDAIAWKIANAPQLPELPTHIPRATKDFLERCLARSRDSRWPAHMLIHHPLCMLLSLPELDSKFAIRFSRCLYCKGIIHHSLYDRKHLSSNFNFVLINFLSCLVSTFFLNYDFSL